MDRKFWVYIVRQNEWQIEGGERERIETKHKFTLQVTQTVCGRPLELCSRFSKYFLGILRRNVFFRFLIDSALFSAFPMNKQIQIQPCTQGYDRNNPLNVFFMDYFIIEKEFFFIYAHFYYDLMVVEKNLMLFDDELWLWATSMSSIL